MSDEIRVNRAPAQAPMKQEGGMMQEPMQKNSSAPWIILAVVVVVIAILALAFKGQLMGNKAGQNGQAMTNEAAGGNTAMGQSSGYQAIFLTNGQVYFGKISNPDSDYVTMKDIYYLQVGPQQGSGTTAGQPTQQAGQSISLVKLGQELHGPVDEMHISRAQVLFYEDLKSDGQVVKAIAAYKANPTGATPTPAK